MAKSKSAGAWVQWGIRKIGEFDLRSAKYGARADAERVLDLWADNRTDMEFELVSVTIRPANPKPKPRRKTIVYGYGNLISWLATAWAIRLRNDGLPEATAIKAVSNMGPHPLPKVKPPASAKESRAHRASIRRTIKALEKPVKRKEI